MPRRPRVFVAGAFYHVYCRFGHGAAVFRETEEADRFVAILREVARTDSLTLLAWCLMPTHYHLAVRTGTRPLWKSLRLIQGRFAVCYTRRHRTLGAIWQGRYKAKLVTSTDSLCRLLAYIHLNPVKAGLTRSPAGYSYSGHRELLGRAPIVLTDVRETLALFGERLGEARRAYAAMVNAGRQAAWLGEEPGRLPWWSRYADEELRPDAARPHIDAQGVVSGTPERPRLTLEQIAGCVCREEAIEQARLASLRQDRVTVRARELLGILGVERCGVRVRDLASFLGKPADTVSRWLTRGLQRQEGDAEFAARLEHLDAALRQCQGE
jgi:putative transposase